MGACASGGVLVSEEELRLHHAAEKTLKDTKAQIARQIKILLLGSGDSGKSTVLKQMRLIHHVPFTPTELEHYRQLIFGNITQGMKFILEAMEDDLGIKLPEAHAEYRELFNEYRDLKDGEPYPTSYLQPLKILWAEESVKMAYERGNEVALPDNLTYFYSDLDRFFDPDYEPDEKDIIHCRARTIGISETKFKLRNRELCMVDVGGQKSERRKWIHCFQDVTSILFLVSLSGYDQCLLEDREENQMKDAMGVWTSICNSVWFKNTPIILFLNKNDLYEERIRHSDIKNTFPDYTGEPGNAQDGREYFRKTFSNLSQNPSRGTPRTVYTHVTNATDTELLRVVMASVEDNALRVDLQRVALI